MARTLPSPSRRWPLAALIGLSLIAAGCSHTQGRSTDAAHAGTRLATASANAAVHPAVRNAQAEAARQVQQADAGDFDDARRGLIAAPHGQVRNEASQVIWDFDAFAFQQDELAPDSVNPSLWRQARLNNQAGLFKVREGIWQLRGFDLSNITLIQGKTGWIVVDTGTSRETSAAAMAFARQHLGAQAVSAVVYTHSHVDHFGGVLGVISADEARARQVPIVAPAGFMEEATSENVLMGTAMARRAMYMYGSRLPASATGLVDNGLGKAVPFGRVGILPPTLLVQQPREEHVIDGVRFVFHNVPGSEAPSEFTFALPELQAFCGAELMGHTLHNLYTLRGAKVRDALRWSGYLNEAITQVQGSEVVFTQHHWPVWGAERIHGFIEHQRDAYQFIHDQTVRGMNAGLTAPEIAETLKLPTALQQDFAVHGYYGTVKHNVKAVYQFYLGWYDANPANLDALPPVAAAKGYVALAGGPEALRASAQKAFDAGDFRWAAELLKHAVYADPGDKPARELLARSFEQMGFLAESAPWRNVYLSGALELREGPPTQAPSRVAFAELLQHTPIERFLEAMAASLNAEKVGDARLTINLVFSDLKESHVLRVANGVLRHDTAPPAADADATLTVTHPFFVRMVTGQVGGLGLLTSSDTKIDGSRLALGRFFGWLDKPAGTFPIVSR
ncbi:alkyl sulfatase dimerization domain-containing protein [Aquabacterium sp.]|uniref:alkyl/aryl-sulfatase n=1 Tax=Aquabacterium sp. TaxID=1872578 RepID=UPI0025C68CC4|nr:alkyl sulfatase dimerization domain-containing protein [Aquabacterium sp.]